MQRIGGRVERLTVTRFWPVSLVSRSRWSLRTEWEVNVLSLAARSATVDGAGDGDPGGDASEKRVDFFSDDAGFLRDAVDAERAFHNQDRKQCSPFRHRSSPAPRRRRLMPGDVTPGCDGLQALLAGWRVRMSGASSAPRSGREWTRTGAIRSTSPASRSQRRRPSRAALWRCEEIRPSEMGKKFRGPYDGSWCIARASSSIWWIPSRPPSGQTFGHASWSGRLVPNDRDDHRPAAVPVDFCGEEGRGMRRILIVDDHAGGCWTARPPRQGCSYRGTRNGGEDSRSRRERPGPCCLTAPSKCKWTPSTARDPNSLARPSSLSGTLIARVDRPTGDRDSYDPAVAVA